MTMVHDINMRRIQMLSCIILILQPVYLIISRRTNTNEEKAFLSWLENRVRTNLPEGTVWNRCLHLSRTLRLQCFYPDMTTFHHTLDTNWLNQYNTLYDSLICSILQHHTLVQLSEGCHLSHYSILSYILNKTERNLLAALERELGRAIFMFNVYDNRNLMSKRLNSIKKELSLNKDVG
jgi:hypothetical protein